VEVGGLRSRPVCRTRTGARCKAAGLLWVLNVLPRGRVRRRVCSPSSSRTIAASLAIALASVWPWQTAPYGKNWGQ
jgi:hypothetical protein